MYHLANIIPGLKPFKAGSLLPVSILAILILCPLPIFPQEPGDDPFDEVLLEDEGLTVTGTPETTQQKKTVTKEEIERINAPDMATLLQETLDLGVTRYGGYGNQAAINMRGFDSERIAILIDGVPVNSTMSGDFDINKIDLHSVDHIEVIYGGSDSKYNVSGALGGIINIITLKKQEPGLRIGGSISNTAAMPGAFYERSGEKGSPQWQDLVDTQNVALNAAYGWKKFSVMANIFANRAENHFLYMDSYNIKRRKDHNEVWDTGAAASLIWDLPDNYSKLLFGGDFYYGDKNIPTSGTSSIAGIQEDISTRQNLMLDMPRVFRDDLAVEASLSHNWANMGYEREGMASSSHNQHTIMAINRWAWYPLAVFTLRIGGDYRYSYLDSTDIGYHDRHDGGVYVTAEYAPVKQVLIIPSIKAVLCSSGTAPVVPVPKLGFVWHATEWLTFKNNYFRSFKLPDFEDLYWVGGGMFGNPDLRPEDGWGADLGGSYRFKNWATLESTFFVQWTQDSIHWYPAGTIWTPQNVGEATFFGLDTKVRFEIPISLGPIKKIVPSLSYQYLLSYLLSYGYTYDSDKRLPYMPMHTIGASLDIPWKSGNFLISGHYETLRYADTANITELDPYFLLNINVNQKIGKNVTAFGVIRNILNQSYESFDDYPMPGLTVTLGIRMHFE
ncbi:MAG: TonB-dependent receptor [Treponema sp.]|jgi:vitamin B12 transporter|nr:TonB-dependent receptor [Treponema sp.]